MNGVHCAEVVERHLLGKHLGALFHEEAWDRSARAANHLVDRPFVNPFGLPDEACSRFGIGDVSLHYN